MEATSGLLSEIWINTGELPDLHRFVMLQNLYNEVLFEDDLWHFFYEAEMGDVIRFKPQFMNAVLGFYETHYPELEMTPRDEWHEANPAVVNNLEYFAKFFHLNSETIIEKAFNVEPNGFAGILDRIIHSSYLNFNFSREEKMIPEAHILSRLSLDRSFYDGIRFRYLQELKARRGQDGNQD